MNAGDRTPVAFKKGKWSEEEDEKLRRAVEEYGVQNWVAIEKFSGLGRQSKNCRLRWFNHLRPNLKRGPFTREENETILRLHSRYGNSWSLIASELPGRSDNEIKNFWNKRVKKCKKHHLPLYPPTVEEVCSFRTKKRRLNGNRTSTSDESGSSNYPNSICLDFPESQSRSAQNVAVNTLYCGTIASVAASPRASISLPNNENDQLMLSECKMSQAQIHHLRKPPVLASVKGRLRRLSRSASESDVSALLAADSSMQMRGSPYMASWGSPHKFKSSSWASAPYSSEIDKKSSNIPTPSFSAPLLNSPTNVPSSPLKLRLSIPVPTCSFQPHFSFQDPQFRSPQLRQSSSCNLDIPTAQQQISFDTYHAALHDSSPTVKAEAPSPQCYHPAKCEVNSCLNEEKTDSNSGFILAPSEIPERVQYLKNVSQSRVPNKNVSGLQNSLRRENVQNEIPTGGVFINRSTKMENVLCKLQGRVNSRKRMRAQLGSTKLKESEKSDTKTSSVTENSSSGSKRDDSKNIPVQRDLIDWLFDQCNSQNTLDDLEITDSWDCILFPAQAECSIGCPIMDSLLSESTEFLKDDFLGPKDMSRPMNLTNEDVLVEDQVSCVGYAFGQESLDGLEEKPQSLEDNEGSDSTRLCESSLLLYQHTETDEESMPHFGHGFSRGDQLGLPIFSKGFEVEIPSRKQEPIQEQSSKNIVLLENIRMEQEQKLSMKKLNSPTSSYMMTHYTESDSSNGESNFMNSGLSPKQDVDHYHMDGMADELSSLLEFFPTTIHTPEWYPNGNAIKGSGA